MRTFIKGAPERVQKLCLPESVPESFKTTLDKYSQQGFRVIALAVKDLTMKKFKVQRAKRDDLEQDARFIGLIVLLVCLVTHTHTHTHTPYYLSLSHTHVYQYYCLVYVHKRIYDRSFYNLID